MNAVANVVDLEARRSERNPEIVWTQPLVPEGEYLLRYDGYQTALRFGRASKVELLFSIMTPGEHFETRIMAFYNARLLGKPRRSGRFKAAITSRLVRELARLLGRHFKRLDELPLGLLRNHLIVGRVEIVTHDSERKEIPECVRYSVVRELLRIEQ